MNVQFVTLKFMLLIIEAPAWKVYCKTRYYRLSRSVFFQSHRSLYHRTIPDCGQKRETRQDGRREKLEADTGRNDAEVGRDIDDEEETGERADAKDKESRGQDEDATRQRPKTPRARQREREAARRAPETQRRVLGRRQDGSRLRIRTGEGRGRAR